MAWDDLVGIANFVGIGLTNSIPPVQSGGKLILDKAEKQYLATSPNIFWRPSQVVAGLNAWFCSVNVRLTDKVAIAPIIGQWSLGPPASRSWQLVYQQDIDRFAMRMSGDGVVWTPNTLIAAGYGSPPVSTWINIQVWYANGSASISINGGSPDNKAFVGPIFDSGENVVVGAVLDFNEFANMQIDDLVICDQIPSLQDRMYLATGAPFDLDVEEGEEPYTIPDTGLITELSLWGTATMSDEESLPGFTGVQIVESDVVQGDTGTGQGDVGGVPVVELDRVEASLRVVNLYFMRAGAVGDGAAGVLDPELAGRGAASTMALVTSVANQTQAYEWDTPPAFPGSPRWTDGYASVVLDVVSSPGSVEARARLIRLRQDGTAVELSPFSTPIFIPAGAGQLVLDLGYVEWLPGTGDERIRLQVVVQAPFDSSTVVSIGGSSGTQLETAIAVNVSEPKLLGQVVESDVVQGIIHGVGGAGAQWAVPITESELVQGLIVSAASLVGHVIESDVVQGTLMVDALVGGWDVPIMEVEAVQAEIGLELPDYIAGVANKIDVPKIWHGWSTKPEIPTTVKDPAEDLLLEVRMHNVIIRGEMITFVGGLEFDSTGETDGLLMVKAAAIGPKGDRFQFRMAGGSRNKQYHFTLVAHTSFRNVYVVPINLGVYRGDWG